MNAHLLSLDPSDADLASPHADTAKPAEFVRQSRLQLSEMTDSALTDYISYCANHFIAAQYRWELTGDFADVGLRDSCWCAEAEALVERGSRGRATARGVVA